MVEQESKDADFRMEKCSKPDNFPISSPNANKQSLDIIPGPGKGGVHIAAHAMAQVAKENRYWAGVPQHTRDFAERQCAENRAREKEARSSDSLIDPCHVDAPEPGIRLTEPFSLAEAHAEVVKEQRRVITEPYPPDSMCSDCPRLTSCKTKSPSAEDLKECCFEMQKELEVMAGRLAGLIENHPAMLTGMTVKHDEVVSRSPNTALSNAWRAFRVIEDAGMRLGKVVQILDGGKSVYPR